MQPSKKKMNTCKYILTQAPENLHSGNVIIFVVKLEGRNYTRVFFCYPNALFYISHRITNASLSDEGSYTCEASNKYGSDRESVRIAIQRIPPGRLP